MEIAAFREALGALGGSAKIITDPDVMATYSRDMALFAKYELPDAVLLARSTQEVSLALKFAHLHQIPVVTRGAGSGLAGGANSMAGSLVIGLEKMNEIIEIDAVNQIARVQAGVINKDIDNEARKFGLAYLPDPASRDWSTIGGNIATNAGGMCCIKYGVTAHHVRALTLVLPNGEVIEIGKSTKKNVTTLDLLHLVIGSEGTLGIITEAILSLVNKPAEPVTLLATFPSISQAAAAAIAMTIFRPSMLELIDATTLRAIEAWRPLGFEVTGAILLMELDERSESMQAALERVIELGATDGVISESAAERGDLLRVRKLAYPALERLGAAILDDVCLPLSRIAHYVEGVAKIATENDVMIGIFGHAGDGNLHPTIVYPHQDEAAKQRAILAFNELIYLAQSMGGTASGEHGIGSIKTAHVEREISSTVLSLQRGIKAVFDPTGIMNPGKKISAR